MNKSARRNIGIAIIGVLTMSLLLTGITTVPVYAQFEELRGNVQEKTYDTEDGLFRIHYKNASEEYVKFVGHAFSKAREFQTALGFKNITLTPNTPDFKDVKVAIYVKDLVYDDKASEVVVGSYNQLQYMLMSDKLEKWQIYLAAAHDYFKAVLTSYNTLNYEAIEGNAWINDGIAKFMVLYTALNDPEYKQYDEQYATYGNLDKVMADGKNTASYQVPKITSASLNKGITKQGALSVSYWYYVQKIYGMKVIQDVIAKTGSYNDDSIKTVSSLLTNYYNTTLTNTLTGWYESLGFWNKNTVGDFNVYEGLMLVGNEMFNEQKSSELPIKKEYELSRYGASFVNLKFDSKSPIMQIRFINSGDAQYVYAYVHNLSTDEYYHLNFTVEKGYQDFYVWTYNAEINFIIIGGDKSFNGGFTIDAV